MHHANYALLPVFEQLGPSRDDLDVERAEFAGDRSSQQTFTVPGTDPVDAYLELQLYDVGEYGHEIVLNGEPLAGFDLPPVNGWQYWMDGVGELTLQESNTLRIHRNGDDSFAVGNVVVHWRADTE